MLDILLLIIFVVSLIVGVKRGFVVQAIHLVSFIVALIVAYIYYKPLSTKICTMDSLSRICRNSTMTLVLDALDVDRTFYRVYCVCDYFLSL